MHRDPRAFARVEPICDVLSAGDVRRRHAHRISNCIVADQSLPPATHPGTGGILHCAGPSTPLLLPRPEPSLPGKHPRLSTNLDIPILGSRQTGMADHLQPYETISGVSPGRHPTRRYSYAGRYDHYRTRFGAGRHRAHRLHVATVCG